MSFVEVGQHGRPMSRWHPWRHMRENYPHVEVDTRTALPAARCWAAARVRLRAARSCWPTTYPVTGTASPR